MALLDDLDKLEHQLLLTLATNKEACHWVPTAWDSLGSVVWILIWRATVAKFSSLLSRYSLTQLPSLARNPVELTSQLRDPEGTLLTREARLERALTLLSLSLSLLLIDRGWTLNMQPGVFFLASGETRLVPRQMVDNLRSGKMTDDAWNAWCQDHLPAPSLPLTTDATIGAEQPL